jgi:hypothetical protein
MQSKTYTRNLTFKVLFENFKNDDIFFNLCKYTIEEFLKLNTHNTSILIHLDNISTGELYSTKIDSFLQEIDNSIYWYPKIVMQTKLIDSEVNYYEVLLLEKKESDLKLFLEVDNDLIEIKSLDSESEQLLKSIKDFNLHIRGKFKYFYYSYINKKNKI